MSSNELSLADFEFVRRHVVERAGIVLEEGKEYLVEARLLPLCQREGFDGLADLMGRLRDDADGALSRWVVDAMTTNETSFFRDRTFFEALRDMVFPELIRARAGGRRLDLWCAASSSGQEAYSVLMMLHESFPELADWDVRFLCSDISDEMIERCRAGIYSQHEVNRGLPAAMLVKYFDRVGTRWQIKPELRRCIDLQRINLTADWPDFAPMDIVMIRNVLIYFDVPTKQKILGRVKRVLQPDGFMFLGAAESVVTLDSSYRRASPDRPGCYQQGVRA